MDFFSKLLQLGPAKSGSGQSPGSNTPATPTVKDHETYVNFAREFIEEIVENCPPNSKKDLSRVEHLVKDVVVSQDTDAPSESNRLSVCSIDSALPDLLQPEAVYKKQVDSDTENSITEYESAVESDALDTSSINSSFVTDDISISVQNSLEELVEKTLSPGDLNSTCNTIESTPKPLLPVVPNKEEEDIDAFEDAEASLDESLTRASNFPETPKLSDISALCFDIEKLYLETPKPNKLEYFEDEELSPEVLVTLKPNLSSDFVETVAQESLNNASDFDPNLSEQISSQSVGLNESSLAVKRALVFESELVQVKEVEFEIPGEQKYAASVLTQQIDTSFEIPVQGKSVDNAVEPLVEEEHTTDKTVELSVVKEEQTVETDELIVQEKNLINGAVESTVEVENPVDETVEEEEKAVDKTVELTVEEEKLVNKTLGLTVEEEKPVDETVELTVEEEKSFNITVGEEKPVDITVDLAVEEEKAVSKTVASTVEEEELAVDKTVELTVEEEKPIDKTVELTVEEEKPVDKTVESTKEEKPIDTTVEEEKPVNITVNLVVEEEKAIDKTVELTVEEEKPVDETVDLTVEEEKPLDETVELTVEEEKPVDKTVESTKEEKPIDTTVEEEKPVNITVNLAVEEEKAIDKTVELTVEEEQPVNQTIESTVEEEKPLDTVNFAVEEEETINKTAESSVEEEQPVYVIVGEEKSVDETVESTVEEEKQVDKALELTVEEEIKPIDKSVELTVKEEKPVNNTVVEEKPVDITAEEEKPLHKTVESTVEEEKPVNITIDLPVTEDKPVNKTVEVTVDEEKLINNTVGPTIEEEKPVIKSVATIVDKEKLFQNSVDSTKVITDELSIQAICPPLVSSSLNTGVNINNITNVVPKSESNENSISFNKLIEICKQQQKQLEQGEEQDVTVVEGLKSQLKDLIVQNKSCSFSLEDILAAEASQISIDIHNASRNLDEADLEADYSSNTVTKMSTTESPRTVDENVNPVPLDVKWLSEARNSSMNKTVSPLPKSKMTVTNANVDEDPFSPRSRLTNSPPVDDNKSGSGDNSNLNKQADDEHFSTENDVTVEVNHSEAGPEIAEQTFAEEIFADSAAFDFLSTKGGPPTARSLRLESLYVKFDPLVSAEPPSRIADRNIPLPPLFQDTINKAVVAPLPPRNHVSQGLVVSHPSQPSTPKNLAIAYVDRLISLSPSPCKEPVHSPIPPPILNQNPPSSPVKSVVLHSNPEEMNEELLILRELLDQQDKAHSDTLAQQLEEKKALECQISGLQLQLKVAEDREKRLKKKQADLTHGQQQMSVIMEEYEKTISRLVAEKEHERQVHEQEKSIVTKEKDVALGHLASIEGAFSDVHQKYERSKLVIDGFKKNEEILRDSLSTYEINLRKQEQAYATIKSHATAQLDGANQELEGLRRLHAAEIAKHVAMLKKAELKSSSLEEMLEQKKKENIELSSICDDLISRVS